jgi:hypothetical protein
LSGGDTGSNMGSGSSITQVVPPVAPTLTVLSSANLTQSGEEMRPTWVKEFHTFRQCRYEWMERSPSMDATGLATGPMDSQSIDVLNRTEQESSPILKRFSLVPGMGAAVPSALASPDGSRKGSIQHGGVDDASSPSLHGGGSRRASELSGSTRNLAMLGMELKGAVGGSPLAQSMSPTLRASDPGALAGENKTGSPSLTGSPPQGGPTTRCHVCQEPLEQKVLKCDGKL